MKAWISGLEQLPPGCNRSAHPEIECYCSIRLVLEYISAFVGCLYAGVVAVPLYPPRPTDKQFRAADVILNCQGRVALSSSSQLPRLSSFFQSQKGLGHLVLVASDSISDEEASQWKKPEIQNQTPGLFAIYIRIDGNPQRRHGFLGKPDGQPGCNCPILWHP